MPDWKYKFNFAKQQLKKKTKKKIIEINTISFPKLILNFINENSIYKCKKPTKIYTPTSQYIRKEIAYYFKTFDENVFQKENELFIQGCGYQMLNNFIYRNRNICSRLNDLGNFIISNCKHPTV